MTALERIILAYNSVLLGLNFESGHYVAASISGFAVLFHLFFLESA